MIRYKFLFGPSIPINETRVWHQSWTTKQRVFFLLFTLIGAMFHPSDQLASAPLHLQLVFWGIGYVIFLFVYPCILLTSMRLTLQLNRSTLYVHLPLELTTLCLALTMYVYARWVGIPTQDLWDLAQFMAFIVALFELGAFFYIAYADRTIFPEVYEAAGPAPANRPPREVFLRGSSIPVHLVEVISAQDNGVQATGQGQSAFIDRPFGLVVSELPVDLGFQIHRSLWISRDLALNFVSEGRKHFIQLPDGRRFPVARARQREYRNWLSMIQKAHQRRA